MKRNNQIDLQEEQELITNRLNHQFKLLDKNLTIPYKSQGIWIDEKNIVQLQSYKSREIIKQYVEYGLEGTSFLNSYAALMHLELGKLGIYYRNCLLSQAEAYEIFLTDEHDFNRYRIFFALNQLGFYVFDATDNLAQIADFRIYKRSNYSKLKDPDSYVIVCDKNKQPLKLQNLLCNSVRRLNYAVIDEDCNVSYYSFDSLNSLEEFSVT